MSDDVIAAFIALGGVLVSTVISIWIASRATRFDYKQLFAQTVSNNRMDWINVWRENLAIFLSRAEVLHHYNCPKNCPHTMCSDCLATKLETELLEAKGKILIRLNLREPKHVLMRKLLTEFDASASDYKEKCEKIELLAMEILKEEWERVKQEANGKK